MDRYLLRFHFVPTPSLDDAVDVLANLVETARAENLIPEQMFPKAKSLKAAMEQPLLKADGNLIREHFISSLKGERYHILSIWGGDPDRGVEVRLMDNPGKFSGRYAITLKAPADSATRLERLASDLVCHDKLLAAALFKDDASLTFVSYVDRSGRVYLGQEGSVRYARATN